MYDFAIPLWIAVPVAAPLLAWHLWTNRLTRKEKETSNHDHI